MPGPPPFGNRWYAQDAAPDVLGPMEAQGTTVRPLRASGRSVSQKMGNFKRYTAVGAHGRQKLRRRI